MASLDDLRKRITSVKSTQKITKAMKMVAQLNFEKLRKVLKKEDLIVKK
jgi:F0F1-type ATP synthase, gamma subunit